jgi:hypothetical protein
MKKFILGLVVALFASTAFATDYFVGVEPNETGNIVKFTKPLKSGDRVILSWVARTTDGSVAFANQGEFTNFGNNSNMICVMVATKKSCGLLSGSIHFVSTPGKVEQAIFTTDGDAPDGIRVKVTIQGPRKTDRAK